MDEIPRFRMNVLAVVCVVLFAGLLTRLWYLQGIDRETFEAASREQRIRVIHEPAPRGLILDRNGVILVNNTLTTVVGATRQDINELKPEARDAMFQRLADKLTSFYASPVKKADLVDKVNDVRWGPLQFIPLVENAPKELEIFFAEHTEDFPGISVRRKTVRTYPFGTTASNILGYVGPINEKEYARKAAEEKAATVKGEAFKHYEPDDEIGKLGIEASLEDRLRGKPGKRIVEVSRTGEIIREIRHEQPEIGDDVWLTIDINAQSWGEWVLLQHQQDLRGKRDKEGRPFRAPQASAVVLSPNTGEIVVAASVPLFNPAALVNGISTPTWKELNDPKNYYPLNNYALQGQYAPGSTFKLVTAYAAVEAGLLDPPNPSGYDDTNGKYTLEGCADVKCTFRNAANAVGGYVDLTTSIRKSNDVFYYWLGHRFWAHRNQYTETAIQNAAKQFGFGQKTGVQIVEAEGNIPTPEKRRQAHKENPTAFPNGNWFTGDNLNLAIGQGEVLVTPLQLTNAYATFANGGTRYQPQIVRMVSRRADPKKPPGPSNVGTDVTIMRPVKQATLKFTGNHYERMMDGFIGVLNSSGGTAHKAFNNSPLPGTWGGKTGTAQAGSKSKPKADTSAFVIFGPMGNPAGPAYAASAILPEAGFGADIAAPTALRILRPLVSGNLPTALTVDQKAKGQTLPSVPGLDVSDSIAD